MPHILVNNCWRKTSTRDTVLQTKKKKKPELLNRADATHINTSSWLHTLAYQNQIKSSADVARMLNKITLYL